MNKLKLGKKKILGFVTAGAIVVTMAGSYAVWDSLEDTASGSLTIDKPVTLTASALTYNVEDRTWDEVPTYTSEPVTFAATDVPTGTTAKVTAKVAVYDKEGEDKSDITNKFDVKIDNTALNESITSVEKNLDSENKATFSVTLTPKETEKDSVGGQKVFVDVTGALSKTTTPASE
ncbi:hypothetical protein GCM10008910_25750 [Faecalicatena orotica]|uniref:Alternate signal-mediated exported protein n=1 Tax=Faecalicatena orotica TaxID=1544 RepID=A0A2Y9BLG6_9FIRM|nr:hypothetical protein [Faecalicatena orotica]PWJ28184.1 hypothetical protein A8806_10962 [Faecalicatena orotica]SSA56637.1 hypothetical protein SAMN05216536_10962 [Faecalicatena orotica]